VVATVAHALDAGTIVNPSLDNVIDVGTRLDASTLAEFFYAVASRFDFNSPKFFPKARYATAQCETTYQGQNFGASQTKHKLEVEWRLDARD